MALRLFPQENRALTLLSQMADLVIDAASAVSRTMGSPVEDRPELLEQAFDIEGRCTDLFFAVMTDVRSSFVTALPRGDLYLLAHHLNTAAEDLAAATHAIVINGLDQFSSRASDLLDLIQRQASLTAEAMHHLSDLEGLDEYWVEVLRMAKQSTRTGDLYRADLIESLKPRRYEQTAQFADKLDSAARHLRSVATEVGRILVQES